MKRLVLILLLLALSSFTPAFGQVFTVSVQTDRRTYTGTEQILINGTVKPPPGTNTGVIVVISNPAGATVDVQDDAVGPTNGTFSQDTVAGGTSAWVAGVYLVNATWGGDGESSTTTTTFQYQTYAPPTTSVSCAPASFPVGATSECTATFSGGPIASSGGIITFAQASPVGPGAGAVSFPSPATCTLPASNDCSITVTGSAPGPVTIQASYPGSTAYPASNGTTTVTVTKDSTTTSISCIPEMVDVGGSTTCTATVTGAAGSIVGEPITWSQLPGNSGSVTLPSPATCSLGSGGACSISLTGATPGSAEVEAAYPGDTDNNASSGIGPLVVLFIHSTVTSSSSSSSSTTSSVTTSSSSASSSSSSQTVRTTSTTSKSASSAKSSTSFVYLGLAAVVVVVVVLAVVLLRRKSAGQSDKTQTKPGLPSSGP